MDAGCEIWDAGWMQDVRFGIQDVRFGLQAAGLLAMQAALEPPALPPSPFSQMQPGMGSQTRQPVPDGHFNEQ